MYSSKVALFISGLKDKQIDELGGGSVGSSNSCCKTQSKLIRNASNREKWIQQPRNKQVC